jgi:8-oxo-dGTP diphosphatase
METMEHSVPQFGATPQGTVTDRPGAYVVVFNALGEILALDVAGYIHLPGGGIDDGEVAEQAAKRELLEESGCTVVNIQYIGESNQFFQSSSIGPLNKQGLFYSAEFVSQDATISKEEDHRVLWLTPDEFCHSNASESQKWAVQLSIGGCTITSPSG